MNKVLLEREGYRFVEAGILEINGKPDYRMQKQNYYTKRWNDIYLFDNVLQCSTAMEDIEYAKWLDPTSILRYIGNFLLLLGYQIMLWGDFKNGLIIKFIGGLLGIPFAIKLKLWDVLFLITFFGITEISKLTQLFLVS